MKKIPIALFLLFFQLSTFSQELSISKTVEYINKILPKATEQKTTIGYIVKNYRIECDDFGNITCKFSLYNPDDLSSKDAEKEFSLNNVNLIWVNETHYSNGTFAGYQLRFEKSKLTVPIYTIEITDKDLGERLSKAFLHLKKITKDDPFR